MAVLHFHIGEIEFYFPFPQDPNIKVPQFVSDLEEITEHDTILPGYDLAVSKNFNFPSSVRHKCNYFSLICLIEGRALLELDTESFNLHPGDFYLIPFAKLNSDGAGVLTREELLDCLNLLWEEINNFYDSDVCITILGSGRTRFNDTILDKQYLLDLIIASYKLTPYKIKLPYKLYIVCQKADDLSLNKIGEYM